MEPLVPSRTALVLVDLINLSAADGAMVCGLRANGMAAEADYVAGRLAEVILPNLSRLLPAARDAGVTVAHARLASRHPAYADIVAPLRPFMEAAEAREGSCSSAPLPGLWHEGDLSVVKTASGAFAGSSLDMLLRRLGVDTVFYAGMLTNACVLLTAATGYDLGYRQFLLSDATGALSERDHADAGRLMAAYVVQSASCEAVLGALPGSVRRIG